MSLKQGPVERLPLELLIEIFCYCKQSMALSRSGSKLYLSVLTLVCRRWRAAALHNSDLWTSFSLVITGPDQLARFAQPPLPGMLETLLRSRPAPASDTTESDPKPQPAARTWDLQIHIDRDLGHHEALVPLTSRGSLAQRWPLKIDHTDFKQNLRRLQLHAHYRYFDAMREGEALQRKDQIWPNLEYLDLNIIDSACDHPVAGQLADEEIFWPWSWAHLPKVYPKLKHLVLRGGCAPWPLPWERLTTLVLDTRAMHE